MKITLLFLAISLVGCVPADNAAIIAEYRACINAGMNTKQLETGHVMCVPKESK